MLVRSAGAEAEAAPFQTESKATAYLAKKYYCKLPVMSVIPLPACPSAMGHDVSLK